MNQCQHCRECCKFAADETYFGPLFTQDEIKGLDKSLFKQYKNSKNVFQIQLVKSKKEDCYVCPLLDEASHLCTIYEKRPFDCKIWPFLFMRDKNNEPVLACFDKELCGIFNSMVDAEFNKELQKMNNKTTIEFLKKHKELIWDFEEDTFIIKRISELN